jgi:hypothetical protein
MVKRALSFGQGTRRPARQPGSSAGECIRKNLKLGMLAAGYVASSSAHAEAAVAPASAAIA